MLNLHQMTDSKVWQNISKVNYHKSNNLARSYQRRRRGDRKAIVDRLLQKNISFELFPEGDNRCCTAYTIKVILNLRRVKDKTIAKMFDL